MIAVQRGAITHLLPDMDADDHVVCDGLYCPCVPDVDVYVARGDVGYEIVHTAFLVRIAGLKYHP